MRSLVWFRSDLRTVDNRALAHAARQGEVVAVFTICPRQWREHDWGEHKTTFVIESVRVLATALEKLNIPMRILETPRFADVPGRLLQLAKQTRCEAIHFNAEFEFNEKQRDEQVRQAFETAGLAAGIWQDQTIVAPTAVRTQKGGAYTVYTPYRRAWLQRVKDDGFTVEAEPAPQKPIKTRSNAVPAKVAGFSLSKVVGDAAIWRPGQHEAQRRLGVFITQRLAGYAKRRDFPAEPATSELSPYLACGAISPRQCLQAALNANAGKLDSGKEGAITWIGELIWREFYRQILVNFPRVSMNQPFDRVMDSVNWSYDEKAFERWAAGRTGVPIVDAAMRQMHATGWMHNRLRMVVAMYLSKDLLIDWRWGERFFMQSLVDGDLANNNGGWQWAASTGTDSVPYFRIFNPVRQGERFDDDGAFVRKWCPELGDLKGKAIHNPDKWGEPLRRHIGWPEPVVDHREARLRTIAAFKKVRAG